MDPMGGPNRRIIINFVVVLLAILYSVMPELLNCNQVKYI